MAIQIQPIRNLQMNNDLLISIFNSLMDQTLVDGIFNNQRYFNKQFDNDLKSLNEQDIFKLLDRLHSPFKIHKKDHHLISDTVKLIIDVTAKCASLNSGKYLLELLDNILKHHWIGIYASHHIFQRIFELNDHDIIIEAIHRVGHHDNYASIIINTVDDEARKVSYLLALNYYDYISQIDDISLRCQAIEPCIKYYLNNPYQFVPSLGHPKMDFFFVQSLTGFGNKQIENQYLPNKGFELLFGDYSNILFRLFCLPYETFRDGNDNDSYSYDFSAMQDAIEELCRINTPISSNLLYLIAKRDQLSLTKACVVRNRVAKFIKEKSVEIISQKETANRELSKRGNPPYKQKLYEDPKSWIKPNFLKRVFNFFV